MQKSFCNFSGLSIQQWESSRKTLQGLRMRQRNRLSSHEQKKKNEEKRASEEKSIKKNFFAKMIMTKHFSV